MKTLKLTGMLPLVLVAASSFSQDDNRAVPRGSGGGSGSDAGSRHTGASSGSTASSSSGAGNHRGSSASGGGGSEAASAPEAARRRPRPGAGTGSRDVYGNDRDRYAGSPNSYYYYDPYAYSWGYPGRRYGYGYYDYGYSYGDYYGYYPSSYARSYRYRSGNIAQLRTMVEPAKARVYVDGYYAGIADDFDGLLQRLNVSPGRHDITFKLEGYTSHTFSIYANRDQTLKLRFDLVRGTGETRDSIGEESERRFDRADDGDDDRYGDTERYQNRRRPNAERADRPSAEPLRDRARGELLMEVQPADASVYVDGEFYGKASQVTRLELPAGRHRIEVVRPGYKTEETEVDVDGETKRVIVKLDRR